jgi:hypothetical protein
MSGSVKVNVKKFTHFAVTGANGGLVLPPYFHTAVTRYFHRMTPNDMVVVEGCFHTLNEIYATMIEAATGDMALEADIKRNITFFFDRPDLVSVHDGGWKHSVVRVGNKCVVKMELMEDDESTEYYTSSEGEEEVSTEEEEVSTDEENDDALTVAVCAEALGINLSAAQAAAVAAAAIPLSLAASAALSAINESKKRKEREEAVLETGLNWGKADAGLHRRLRTGKEY